MKRKFFIALYTIGIVIAVALFSGVVTILRRAPINPLTPEERADIGLSQYTERPNSTTTYGTSNIPIFLAQYLFPEREPLAPGCSLRFALDPVKKAVEPSGTIDYKITVSNQGKDVCQNASLSLYYSSTEHYMASDPKPTASDYYWSFGDIDPAKAVTISLTTKNTSKDGQDIISEGCASADNAADVCSQTVIFVQSGASKTPVLSDNLAAGLIAKVRSTISGSSSSSRFKVASSKEFGIWVWDSPKKMTTAYASEVIDVAQKNGFNVIYLTIDDYIPISQGGGTVKDKDTKDYMKALAVFIQTAKQAGIQVDVVGGSKDWSKPENRWKGYALIDFVKLYNNTYPNAPIRNLQYDVEPYLLADYDADKASILKEYVAFIDESARRMKNVPAGFSIVIPHFYDKEQNWTPAITYNGVEAHTYTHLLRVLAQKNNTQVLVMAYRNFLDGQNGTEKISQEEIEEAGEGNYHTKVIVAQETGDVSPAYVTFHDYPKVSLYDALSQIQTTFNKDRGFGGTAVHYLDSFMKLE